MNKTITTKVSAIIMALTLFASCNLNDDDSVSLLPTALVTVKPTAESFYLQLDDSTRLQPSNLTKSPYGDKEVRALVNYRIDEKKSDMQHVFINWMDSIRTKTTVPSLGEKNNAIYGNDPVEIVQDWVTVAEDGYLTLRVRTKWGNNNTTHYLNLITGTNAENPYELELRHDAKDDTPIRWGDALIAFNLRSVIADAETDKVKFVLRWNSFSGEKKSTFELKTKTTNTRSTNVDAAEFSASIK